MTSERVSRDGLSRQNSSIERAPRAPVGTAQFWIIVAIIIALDAGSKALAVQHLAPRYMPHPVIGDFFRFTLAYNPGAAFGMHVGPASRWIFASLSVVIVFVLIKSTVSLTRISPLAAVGVPIIVGGALGNLLDRIRFRDGVVDFIDIGIGDVRFWTFNLADTAVTIGAACLVIALWEAEKIQKHQTSVS